MARILIVEDEPKIADTVALYLRHAGHAVDACGDGLDALRLFRAEPHDLVVLDLMLPGLHGRDLCRRLRAESTVPILMLTARTAEDERIRGLELGADDYICKPFSPRELVARVHAALRRTALVSAGEGVDDGDGPLAWGSLRVRAAERRVSVATAEGEQALHLTPTELDLLILLLRRPGRVFRRGELVDRLLGTDFDGHERTIDAHVGNLRRKLEAADPRLRPVETVFGTGYRLADPPEITPGDPARGDSSR